MADKLLKWAAGVFSTFKVSADKILGRLSAGTGDVEEIACTAAGRALLDDADAAAQLVTLGVINAVYPVGSIYTSVVATNPGTLFGVGTWAAFGTGKVLVGLDAGQSEFDTVEETGGEKTHVLTVAELAAHSHTFRVYQTVAGGGGFPRASELQNVPWDDTEMSIVGSDTAHNNLQPYIVVYRWKRTA